MKIGWRIALIVAAERREGEKIRKSEGKKVRPNDLNDLNDPNVPKEYNHHVQFQIQTSRCRHQNRFL